MSLFAKKTSEIYDETIKYLKENTALSAVGPGSRFRAIVEIFTSQLSEAYQKFDYNFAASLVYGAEGKFLDYLGSMFKVYRLSGSYSGTSEFSKNMRIYTVLRNFGAANNGQDIIIPAGTIFWGTKSGQRISFINTSQILLDKANKEAFASIEATNRGIEYNMPSGSIVNVDFTNYADYKNNSILVSNVDSIDNGADSEPDENYRLRILNSKFSLATGNETALFIAALGVPGVADAIIIPHKFGTGTASVMIKSTTPEVSDELIYRVQFALDNVKQAFSIVVAEKPTYKYMSFVVLPTYKVGTSESEKLNIQQSIRSIIRDYVNNLDIGETFFPNTLASNILSLTPISSLGRYGRFFESIQVETNILNKYTTKKIILSDFTPESNEKLLLSNNDGVRFI